MSDQKAVIIGAGLAGSLLSIYLARRGVNVSVFEARSDMRKETVEAGRSINLALSDRGIAALSEVGMDEYMLAEAVPMYGRMIHDRSGKTKLLPYSGRKGEYINSVSRAGLNIALMNEAEKYPGVKFVFNERCIDFDCRSGEALFEGGLTARADTTIATDGAGSPVRQAMHGQIADFDFSSVFLDHGYKELVIPSASEVSGKPPAATGGSDNFLLEPNALHIWPRHKFMMIALPNFDGSFTCTLFLAHRSVPEAVATGDVEKHLQSAIRCPQSKEPAFDQLKDDRAVLEFFNREFPDAVPLMPTLVKDFFNNPTGSLGTIKCWPWNVGGKALLLGDSAHAMVPFYGQGMNCAFEDVRVLDSLIEKQVNTAETTRRGDNEFQNSTDWESVFEEFCALRKPNADAIQDMAEENFYEMRDATADPVFQRKRELETRLEQTYPDYFSKYSMVTFREDLPYSTAKSLGNLQDEFLMRICEKAADVNELDPANVMAALRKLNLNR